MGDRTSVEITFLKKDRDIIEEESGGFEMDIPVKGLPGFLQCDIPDMNGGGTEIWIKLAKMGIQFYGSHGAGYEYSEHVFISDGKDYFDWPSKDGMPIVQVPSASSDLGNSVTFARKYYHMLRIVKADMMMEHKNAESFVIKIERQTAKKYRLYGNHKDMKPGLYFALFHGTKNNDQREQCGDEGFPGAAGPTLGPIQFAQGTYNTHIVLQFIDNSDIPEAVPHDYKFNGGVEIKRKYDCYEFDGITYGDFTVFYWDGEKVVGS